MMNMTREIITDRKSPMVTPQATRVMPQLWCTACARLRWMVTLEEANQLLAKPSGYSHRSDEQQHIQRLTKGHQMQLSSGALVICLHALFPEAF